MVLFRNRFDTFCAVHSRDARLRNVANAEPDPDAQF